MPEGFVVKAVGFRKSGVNTKTENIPFNISDYWSEFNPDFSEKSGNAKSLLGYIVKARRLRGETGELSEVYSTTMTGILRFLHILGAKNSEGLKLNSSRLTRELEINNDKGRFQKLVAAICISCKTLDKEYWTYIIDTLLDITKVWHANRLSPEAESFIEWDEELSNMQAAELGQINKKINILNHHGLEIEVGTIHSVKGETHSATLVLETYLNKDHDLKQLLPYIKGESDASENSLAARLKEHMRRIFVGGTRPREIVGIAMHKDHLGIGDLEKMRSIGWEIEDLTQKN